MSQKAAATRLSILRKAFELTYKKGYQATSVDEILKTLDVTKGAFFYHFKHKEEMGLAMISEVMYPGMYASLIAPLSAGKDSIHEICSMMEGLLLGNPFFDVRYGCPAINLIDEMAPLNSGFSKALADLTNHWREAIEACLKKGKLSGQLRNDFNEGDVSLFIISGYAGIRNLGKIYGESCYAGFLVNFKEYLNSLRSSAG